MSKFLKTVFAVLAAVALLATQANAQLSNMTYTFSQVGENVVMNSSGSFNVFGEAVGTPSESGFGFFSGESPMFVLVNSQDLGTDFPLYSFAIKGGIEVNQITDLDEGFSADGTDLTGAANGIALLGAGGIFNTVYVITPIGYSSGTLTSSMTFANTNLAAFGLEIGDSVTFEYAQTSEGTALGSITLSAVPEPSALMLVGSIVTTGLVRRRRR